MLRLSLPGRRSLGRRPPSWGRAFTPRAFSPRAFSPRGLTPLLSTGFLLLRARRHGPRASGLARRSSRSRRSCGSCRRFLTCGASGQKRRKQRNTMQSVSPTHPVLRACNQQGCSQLTTKGNIVARRRQRPRLRIRADCRKPPGASVSEKHVRQFLTTSTHALRATNKSHWPPVCAANRHTHRRSLSAPH
jgi:hypothetical protein